MARVLSNAIDFTQQGLFWITAWGIFPSSENRALFDAYRRSLDEHRSLQAAPGHLITERDVSDLECLMDMALYFYWDASLIDASSFCIRLSHDECISL